MIKICPVCNKEFNSLNKTCSKDCSYLKRGKDKTINLIGKKRNLLKIIALDGHIKTKVSWLALCDCGKKVIITTGGFSRKDGKETKSCGCLQSLKGENSQHWKGIFGISSTYWSRAISQSMRRNIEFKIDQEYVFNIFIKQNKKCALSGIDLILNKNASIDRIDSKIGYIEGNIQWVHKDINRMKSDFLQEYFIDICKKIAIWS